MPRFSPEMIRSIALVGHGAAGKTTLAEALLHRAGVIAATGSVEKGSTVCDFDPLEKSYQHSLNAAAVHLTVGDTRIHLIDTPGLPDFVGRAINDQFAETRCPAVDNCARSRVKVDHHGRDIVLFPCLGFGHAYLCILRIGKTADRIYLLLKRHRRASYGVGSRDEAVLYRWGD